MTKVLLFAKTAVRSFILSGSTTSSAPSSSIPTPQASDYFAYASNQEFISNTGSIAGGKKYLQLSGVASSFPTLTLDTNVLYNGHPTARHRYYSGSSSKPEMIANGINASDIWYRWVVKWQRGFCNDVGNGYTGAFAAKQSDFGFNGINGRVLGSITNGTGTPGADGNDGDLQFETVSITNGPIFLNTTLRKVNSGSSQLYTDEQWYEYIVHWKRENANYARTQVWFQRDGDPRELLATFNCRDLDQNTANSLGQSMFFNAFNAISGTPPSGGPPAAGVDQSVWLGEWQMWSEASASNPLGLGTTGSLDVDISSSLQTGSITLTTSSTGSTGLYLWRGAGLASASIELDPMQNLPTGVSASFTGGNTIAAPTVSSSIKITTTGAATPGTYIRNINVSTPTGTGRKGAASYSLPITINVI